jgi:hypothetical protein
MLIRIQIFSICLAAITLPINSRLIALKGGGGIPDLNQVNHGDVQVSTLVQDRPQLQDIIYRNNPIWKWLQNAFNYSNGGIKIYWDPGPTMKANTFGGETEFLQDSGICFIRVDRTYKEGDFIGVDKRAEEVLATLILELNNAQHRDENMKIWKMALEGKLTRNEFILACARLEFGSEQGVKQFLVGTWLPFCESRHIQSDYQIWWMSHPGTFDDMMKFYPPGSDYPWKIYGDQYDQIVQAQRNK